MRKSVWVFLLLLLAVPATAQITVPYTFTAGDVADPDEVNANFLKFGDACNRTGCVMTGPLTWGTDNTFDIGANGATRPRRIYVGTEVVAPLFTGAFSGSIVSASALVSSTLNTGPVVASTGNFSGAVSITGVITAVSGIMSASLSATQITSSTSLTERGRSVPLGEWSAPAFNALYYSSDSGAWNVDEADVTLNRVTYVGTTATVAFTITGTDVTGTPAWLQIRLPAVAARTTVAGAIRVRNAGTWGTALGFCYVTAGQDYLYLARDGAGGGAGTTWSATTGDNTDVSGTCTFEIQ